MLAGSRETGLDLRHFPSMLVILVFPVDHYRNSNLALGSVLIHCCFVLKGRMLPPQRADLPVVSPTEAPASTGGAVTAMYPGQSLTLLGTASSLPPNPPPALEAQLSAIPPSTEMWYD